MAEWHCKNITLFVATNYKDNVHNHFCTALDTKMTQKHTFKIFQHYSCPTATHPPTSKCLEFCPGCGGHTARTSATPQSHGSLNFLRCEAALDPTAPQRTPTLCSKAEMRQPASKFCHHPSRLSEQLDGSA